MADKNQNTNQEVETTADTENAISETKTVEQVDQLSAAQLENAISNPDKQMLATGDKVVGDGENLYFFPTIQKSVVATSLEAATAQVQTELDALNEGNK